VTGTVGANDALYEFAARWGLSPDSPRLRAALTHTSAAPTVAESNERLEFLGDALLSAYVARWLMDTLPPETGEDSLSRARVQIVRKETLAAAARALGLADLLVVGAGERKEQRNNRESVLADAYEALLAAVYLDRGEEAMAAFIRDTLAEPLAAVRAAPPEPDAKTTLQMRLQAAGLGLPEYRLLSATGKGHDHHFIVEVVDSVGSILGRGEGPNKRTAQMNAAREALGWLIAAEPPTPEVAAARSEVSFGD
jgi:ribonuclease III